MITPGQFEFGIGQEVDENVRLPDVLPWADVTLCDVNSGDRLTLSLPEDQLLIELRKGGIRVPSAQLESHDDSTLGDTFNKIDIAESTISHGRFMFNFLNHRGRPGQKTFEKVGSIIVCRVAVPESSLVDVCRSQV
ncbi:MAG: hypothetical protein JWN82_401 [Candidatus Saccharibacteria bacterium]|nr:hypothetical protein [Candidatus Saccharibacteria bacterium]